MIDLSFYLPELILLISLSFIILFDLFLPNGKKEISYYLIQASLILSLFYLSGNFEKSQKDIDKVLELEKRHFGALAGQGLVNIQLKNYNKAIKSYEKAKEIYPTMKSPDMMINQIKELIKKQSI